MLIHIPKTEGTNVELGFWYSNKLGVGENMFSKTSPSVSEKVKMRESKYAIVSQSTPACPNWHMPPSSFVHVRKSIPAYVCACVPCTLIFH